MLESRAGNETKVFQLYLLYRFYFYAVDPLETATDPEEADPTPTYPGVSPVTPADKLTKVVDEL